MKHASSLPNKLGVPNCSSCPRAQNGLLSTCQHEQLDMLANSKASNFYLKGQLIYTQGSQCHGLHCIYQGKVKITKTAGDGKEHITRLANAGDIVGTCAILGETTYQTSAVALEDSVVCLIPRQDVVALLQSNVQFVSSLMKQLSQSLNMADYRSLTMAYKPVRERLAEALLLLSATYRQDLSQPFTIAFSREDLASLVGTAKETVTRLLSELKEAAIVATQGSRITLLDPEKLAEISTQYD